MSKNLIPAVAEMLGLKLREKFRIELLWKSYVIWLKARSLLTARQKLKSTAFRLSIDGTGNPGFMEKYGELKE